MIRTSCFGWRGGHWQDEFVIRGTCDRGIGVEDFSMSFTSTTVVTSLQLLLSTSFTLAWITAIWKVYKQGQNLRNWRNTQDFRKYHLKLDKAFSYHISSCFSCKLRQEPFLLMCVCTWPRAQGPDPNWLFNLITQNIKLSTSLLLFSCLSCKPLPYRQPHGLQGF